MKKPETHEYPRLLTLLEEICTFLAEHEKNDHLVKEGLDLLESRVSKLEGSK